MREERKRFVKKKNETTDKVDSMDIRNIGRLDFGVLYSAVLL